MSKYVTFKRTALLMLMFLLAWCLPMKGESNGYSLSVFERNIFFPVNSNYRSESCLFKPAGAPSTIYALFKWNDPTAGDKFQVSVNDSSFEQTSDSFWFTIDESNSNYVQFNYSELSATVGDSAAYTVSLYASQDATGTALATFTGCLKAVSFKTTWSSNAVRGNVGEDIPVSLQITEIGGFETTNMELRIYKMEGLTLSCSSATLQESETSNEYILPIADLQTENSFSFTLKAEKELSSKVFNPRFYKGEDLILGSSVPVVIPYTVSSADSVGLMKIGTDNNNPVIEEYVKNRAWLSGETNDKISTWWYNVSPDRLRNLSLLHWKDSLTVLDVTPFDSLTSLFINGCNISSLDLSSLTHLQTVYLLNTKLPSFSAVKFPTNGITTIEGNIKIENLGDPIEGSTYREMTAGDTIDLTGYMADSDLFGQSYFTWYDNSGNQVVFDSIATGKYILPTVVESGVRYRCKITTEKYPNWYSETNYIQLKRGAITYSEEDIALLKALAAANPNSVALGQFVADSVKGWEEPWAEYSVDPNRRVAVDWNNETPARIVKLRLREMRGEITSLDLTGFTELEYLDCRDLNSYSNNLEFSTLDLSQNTKLTYLNIGNCRFSSLDLSNNPLLEQIYANSNKFETLDLSKHSSLQYLSIYSCDSLRGIDFTKFSSLKFLDIGGTTYFGEIAKNPLQTITNLYCNYTNYELLDFSKYPNLRGYGVPSNIEELDVSGTSGLTYLDMGGSKVRYSTLTKPEGTNIGTGCNSRMRIPGLENIYTEENPLYTIHKGDTIDLSSEAYVGTVASIYKWIDVTSATEVEENTIFEPIEGQLGKFVYNGNGTVGRQYRCCIMNQTYNSNLWFHGSLSYNNGGAWNVWTYSIKFSGTYNSSEIAALEQIINQIDDEGLTAWWQSGEWKYETNITYQSSRTSPERFAIGWTLESSTGELHLTALDIRFFDGLKELDASVFTKLNSLSVMNCPNLETLSASGCANLKSFGCCSPYTGTTRSLTSVTLPENKESLTSVCVRGETKLTSLDLTDYKNLKYIDLLASDLSPINLADFDSLRDYYVPLKTTQVDLTKAANLEWFIPIYSQLKYSDVTVEPGKTYRCTKDGDPDKWGGSPTYIKVEGLREDMLEPTTYVYRTPYYAVANGEQIDLLAERVINGNVTTVTGYAYDRSSNAKKELTVAYDESGKLSIEGAQPNDRFDIKFANATFAYWYMHLQGHIYTVDGDANLDSEVDVRDVVVTANHIVKDSTNMLPDSLFGFNQADVNYSKVLDVTDVQGIINLILGKPVTKSLDLRATIPSVELFVENGILYMNAEAPVAAVQLELGGVTKAESLLGKAATFTQVSAVNETVRIIGYNMNGETIPAGKSALMKWTEGATLVNVVLSDSKAESLNVITKGIPTANETITVTAGKPEIVNYPNPFQSTTTLVYQLDEAVDKAFVQVYALNGALVDVVSGLDTQAGENRYVYSTRLAAGTYFYRLVTQKQGVTTYSKSNIFMIK